MCINQYRSFTFYNYRTDIPKEENENTFKTLGYFDEFKTNTFSAGDNLNNGDMERLWTNINTMNKALVSNDLNSDSSFQNICGFPYLDKSEFQSDDESNCKEVKDKDFWKNNENQQYAYIFIILVQFFDLKNDLVKKISAYKNKFKEHIEKNLSDIYYKEHFLQDAPNNEKKAYIITDYLTFDKYDYILCVKSNCYLPFVLAMQQLYSLYSEDNNDAIALNSFTVTAINSSNNMKKIHNEILPSICIKCNYNENNIYLYNREEKNKDNKFNVFENTEQFKANIHKELYSNVDTDELEKKDKNYFKSYFISGEDDIRVIARMVPVINLINLIINPHSVLFDKFLFRFSTVINVSDNKLCDNNFFNIEVSRYVELLNKIIDCKKKIENLVAAGYPEELTKTLHQINSGLSAIKPTNKYYRGYGFYSIFPDFYQLISELLRYYQVNEFISKGIINGAFDLIHSIGSALLTTVRSDFKEFQIATFNANLYYAPTKLLVFYRAYIKIFLNFYNYLYDGSKEIFIINTGNNTDTIVKEKLEFIDRNDGQNVQNKFIICNMSEKSIYTMKTSLIQLTHEISHFGMKKIRNRKVRYHYVLDSYFRCYSIFFRYELTRNLSRSAHEKNYRNLIEKYITQKEFEEEFFNLLQKYCVEPNKERYTEVSDDRFYFKEIVKKIKNTMKENILSVNKEAENIIINYFLSRSVINVDTKALIFKLCSELSFAIDCAFASANKCILDKYNDLYKDNYSTVDQFIHYYYKEGFADIVAILSLRLNPSDYLDTLKNGSNLQRKNAKEKVNNIYLKYRFYVVFNAINNVIKESEENDDYEFRSSLAHFKMFSWKEEQTEIKETVEYYKNFLNDNQTNLLSNGLNQSSEKNKELLSNIINGNDKNFRGMLFFDKKIYMNFVGYLSCCIKLYLKNYPYKNSNIYLPHKVFFEVTDASKLYYEKILYIDRMLSDFETNCQSDLFEAK